MREQEYEGSGLQSGPRLGVCGGEAKRSLKIRYTDVRFPSTRPFWPFILINANGGKLSEKRETD